MHIPMQKPDLLVPQANPLQVQEDQETGQRLDDDPLQNPSRTHVAGSKLRDASGESVRGFEDLPHLSPTSVEAWA